MSIGQSSRIESVKYNENIFIPNKKEDENRKKIKNYLKKSLTIEVNDIISNFSTDLDNDDILYYTTLNFFLCTNCNDYIHINHIENHSNKCIIYSGIEYQDSIVYLKEVDDKLKKFDNCVNIGKEYKMDTDKESELLIIGANVGGFLKISQSLIEQGYFY